MSERHKKHTKHTLFRVILCGGSGVRHCVCNLVKLQGLLSCTSSRSNVGLCPFTRGLADQEVPETSLASIAVRLAYHGPETAERWDRAAKRIEHHRQPTLGKTRVSDWRSHCPLLHAKS